MPARIDPAQPIPIYFQLKTLLLEEILSGVYRPGERLPTEHELCAIYEISRTPVTRALSELAQDGVILRHRRRGTFVNPHWVQRQPNGRELRIVVPDGPWEDMIREATPPGVGVNVARVNLPDLHQVLTRAIAEGRGPDLAVLDSVWVAEFAAAGFLRPLDELAPDWLRDEYEADFVQPFVAANRVDGQTVAVQAEADVAGIWYRRDDLAALGLQPPATWAELVAVGRALAAKHRSASHPIVLPGGSRGGETTTYCLLALLASNGVSVLGPDGVTLDTPRTVEALDFLRDLVATGLLPAEAVTYEWDRPIRMLGQGHATISFGGSYEGPALAEAAGVSADEVWQHFGFVATPAGPSGPSSTLAGGMVYGILRQAAYPEQAMHLLEHLVSADGLARMSRTTSQIPSRRTAVAAVADSSPLLSATAAMLERAVVRPATPAYARVSSQLQALLESVLTGRLDPASASERTADLIGAITGIPVLEHAS
ncbi:MAG TPA: extracellular solute-binding protein [Gaiellaceae bacterium]|jgi:ABC-type glycerol-3-phosphate transport system substrate-binding protein/DNA-binding transcriptional regulator YhcF (GntR family)